MYTKLLNGLPWRRFFALRMLLAVSDCVGAHTYSMHLDDATTMGHSDDYHQAASSVSAPAAAAIPLIVMHQMSAHAKKFAVLHHVRRRQFYRPCGRARPILRAD